MEVGQRPREREQRVAYEKRNAAGEKERWAGRYFFRISLDGIYFTMFSVCVCREALCMITFSLVWSSTSSGEKLIGCV